QHLRGDAAAAGVDVPASGQLVPSGVLHLVAEVEVVGEAVPVGTVAQVRQDLRLRGEAAAPAGVQGEVERVELRGHVARRARVGVVAPGAAEVVRAFQDDERLDAVLLQLGGGRQPGEPAADDG